MSLLGAAKTCADFSTTHGALMGGSHGLSRGAIGLLWGSSLVSHVTLFWGSSGDALTSKKAQKEALSGSLASCPCTPTAYVAPGASAVLRGYNNLRGHGGSNFTAKFSGRPPDQRSAALEISRIPVDGGSHYLRQSCEFGLIIRHFAGTCTWIHGMGRGGR
jgi:hypothetical protein